MKKHRIVFSLIMTLILSMSMAIPTFAASSNVIKKTSSKGTAVVKDVSAHEMTFKTPHHILKADIVGSGKNKMPNPRKKAKYNYKREKTFYKNGDVKVEYKFTKKGYYSGRTFWKYQANGKSKTEIRSLKFDKKKNKYYATFRVLTPDYGTSVGTWNTLTVKAAIAKRGRLPKKGETYNYSWTSKAMDGYTGTHKKVTYRFTKSKKMGFKGTRSFTYGIIKAD